MSENRQPDRRGRRRPLRQQVHDRARAPAERLPDDRDARTGDDAARGRGADARGRPPAQPRDVRDHAGWSPKPSGSSPRTSTATSSITPSTPARQRSSSAASGCWPTSTTHPARPRARAPRAPPRRSCSAPCRSSGTGASGARPTASPPTSRTSCSAATCTWYGRSSAATSTSSRGSSRCRSTSSRSGPRTWSLISTRTRSGWRRCWARPSPGTATTSSGSTRSWATTRSATGIYVPLHIDGASGGFVWPFLYPDYEWDFRLDRVRSINVSGHKYGLVYPGIGWLDLPRAQRPQPGAGVHRELPREGRRHLHAQLLHRRGDGAGPVLQLRPLRPRGLRLHHGDDEAERERSRRRSRVDR